MSNDDVLGSIFSEIYCQLDHGRVASARAVFGGGVAHLQGSSELAVADLQPVARAAATRGRGEWTDVNGLWMLEYVCSRGWVCALVGIRTC